MSNQCGHIGGTVCGEHGPVVLAAAYLTAHFDLDAAGTTRCNGDTAIPWVWTARYATELAFQGAAYALACMHNGGEYPKGDVTQHSLKGLMDVWFNYLDMAHRGDTSYRSSPEIEMLKAHCQEIDREDPDGMLLRYVYQWASDNKTVVGPANPELDAHCSWPERFFKMIEIITYSTKDHVGQECCSALGFLHHTAKKRQCLGDYIEGVDYWDDAAYEPVNWEVVLPELEHVGLPDGELPWFDDANGTMQRPAATKI